MRTGRPRAAVMLTPEEQQQLDSLAHRSRSAPEVARRARIILACAEGCETTAVAKRLRVSPTTVCKWRTRFLAERLEGLFDEPRPGAPRTITDDHVEEVVIRTLETTPLGAAHWSVREMAKASGISRASVHRIWRAFGLQPHRRGTVTLPTDPLPIEQIRDIVGLYLNPPDHAVALSVDDETQIQAVELILPRLPVRPGHTERRTPDVTRHGTTSLFAALDIKTSRVISQCHRRQRSLEFRRFLDAVDAVVPEHLTIPLIVDDAGTHRTPLIGSWLAARSRFHVHVTPASDSWLILVERWFAALTTGHRGSSRSVSQLEGAIKAFIEAHDLDPRPFAWTTTADDILAPV